MDGFEKGRHFGTLDRGHDFGEGEEDEGEELNEDGVLFYVNKSGFPVDQTTWNRMWNHVAKMQPSAVEMIKKIKDAEDLPQVAIPSPPINTIAYSNVPDRLDGIQKYMNDLQYNHTGTQFFEIRKNRPISGLMESAREMIRESLPIKCLEAVILGIYLTNGMTGLDRFPISFKTSFMGNTHRHVVLGVYYMGKYGALGMSRRSELMYKPLIFKNLSHMALDFQVAYEKCWHVVKKIKIGLPVPHDSHSYEQMTWKYLSLDCEKLKQEEMCQELDRVAREMRSQNLRSTMQECSPTKKIGSLYSPKKENKSKVHNKDGTPKKQNASYSGKIKDTVSSNGSPNKAKSTDPAQYQIRV